LASKTERAARSIFSGGRDALLVAVAVTGLLGGLTLWWMGFATWFGIAWTVATLPVLAALILEIVGSLRKGDVGLDLVAALSMSAALAFGETLAANVVALMYAGGQMLETFAEGRAKVEMTALLGRVAQTAMRYEASRLQEVAISEIKPGDRLLIREGEVLPVDGTPDQRTLLDLSALTGESRPQAVLAGEEAMSGSTAIGKPFDLIATRPASESTYSRVARLVADAQTRKAPMSRLADRYAVVFLLLTVVLAGAAWIVSGDPIRGLSVLVVATPCPLILAVPVALISGISRSAKAGVLVKNGGVLEALARVRTAVFDKTGTLTHGEASVGEIAIHATLDRNEVLRLAASLDLASKHVVAAALVREATRRGLELAAPEDVDEVAGSGVEGTVENRRVLIGSTEFMAERGVAMPAVQVDDRTAMSVLVAVDGTPVGTITLIDRVRVDATMALQAFREAGISKIVLASGDRQSIAAAVGRELQVDDARGELSPAQKVDLVTREAAMAPVMMIGDGVNDAPALAAADVGVALGARGAAASTETAGVVVLVDALTPLPAAVRIAQRTRAIAVQSVVWGLGLSIAAMVVAAFGYLPPVQGALLQEAIDVAVILNALRALR
jgi:heavy metal translocating P-type ATPase